MMESMVAIVGCADAQLRGLEYLLHLFLGLAPQALCFRLLRRLTDFAKNFKDITSSFDPLSYFYST